MTSNSGSFLGTIITSLVSIGLSYDILLWNLDSRGSQSSHSMARVLSPCLLFTLFHECFHSVEPCKVCQLMYKLTSRVVLAFAVVVVAVVVVVVMLFGFQYCNILSLQHCTVVFD